MRRKTTEKDLEKLIILFTDLSRLRERKNLFALDDAIGKPRFPRYCQKMINLVLWGMNPLIIANNLIHDYTLLFIKARCKMGERDLIYQENIMGYGLYYLQKCIPPGELEGKLRKQLLYMRNHVVLSRNFQGSYYERFYLE